MEWCVSWGIVCAEMKNSTLDSFHGAESVLTVTMMANGLSPDSVLLVGECERDVICSIDVIQRTCCGGDVVESSRGELDVGESEGGTATRIGGGRDGVFAGTAQKEESDDGHVQEGSGKRLVGMVLELDLKGLEDGDTDRPDARGWRVFISEELVEALEAR